jgi:sortase A
VRAGWRRGGGALGGATVVLAAALGFGLVERGQASDATAPVVTEAPSPVPSTTATTAAVTTTTASTAPPATQPANLIRLPVPELLPDDAYQPTPEVHLGAIEIPSLGVSDALQTGMTLTAINRGPSWWPGTARPGQLGNVVVGGHRTTYSRPFQDLHRLVPGDPVIFRTDAGTFTYLVTGTQIVDPDAVEIADQTPQYTATLFACHPPGSARYRIVVHLQLVDGAGQPVAGPPGVTVANAADIIRYRS